MGALKITGQSAEPTVTASDAGTIYYDSDTNKLRHYNGTAWADVSPAAAALTSADLPAGSVVQTVHTTYDGSYSIAASSTSTFVDWDTVIKASITNVLASSHILITIMYSPTSVNGEAFISAVFRSSDGTDSGTFTKVEGTGTVTGSQQAAHDGYFQGAANVQYGIHRIRRSIQILDTSPRTGTNQYRFRSTDTAQYNGVLYLGRSIDGGTTQYDSINPTTFNLMEIAQ